MLVIRNSGRSPDSKEEGLTWKTDSGFVRKHRVLTAWGQV